MLIGDVFYYFPSGERQAGFDRGVTSAYARRASESEPVFVKWENTNGDRSVVWFWRGKEVPYPFAARDRKAAEEIRGVRLAELEKPWTVEDGDGRTTLRVSRHTTMGVVDQERVRVTINGTVATYAPGEIRLVAGLSESTREVWEEIRRRGLAILRLLEQREAA